MGGIGQPFYIAHAEPSAVVVVRLELAALVGQRRAKWVTRVPLSPVQSISGSNLSENHAFLHNDGNIFVPFPPLTETVWSQLSLHVPGRGKNLGIESVEF